MSQNPYITISRKHLTGQENMDPKNSKLKIAKEIKMATIHILIISHFLLEM